MTEDDDKKRRKIKNCH